MSRACALVFLAACNHGNPAAGDLGAPDAASDLAALDLAGDFATPIDLYGGACAPPPPTCTCPPPSPSTICLYGTLFDFAGNFATTPPSLVRVSAYDSIAFLSNPSTAPSGCSLVAANGCYVIPDLTPPATGLFGVVVDDDPSIVPSLRKYVPAYVGAAVTAGSADRVDAWLVSRALVSSWSSSAGVDWAQSGAIVAQFFDAAPPAPTNLTLGSSRFVGGVNVVSGTMPPSGLRFFTARNTVGASSLGSTQAGVGLAIFPPAGLLSSTGSGGNCNGGQLCKWQTENVGSAAGVIAFAPFYACNYDPTAPGCM